MKNPMPPWTTLLLALALAGPAWPEEQRFDVVAKEAPARTFFEGLVDGSPYNIVFEPGVTGTISLRLKHVTVTEVLDALGDAYGYDYRRTSNGFVIVPPVIQTRLFQVNYLDMERRGTSRTRVESGQVGQGPNGSFQQAGQMGGDSGQSGSLSEPPGSMFAGRGGEHAAERVKEITGTSISTRTASDFWRDLEASLKALVGEDHGHNVVVNAQSGIIAVRAMPRELRDVARFLGTLQEVSTRQVVLEAKIVEVELGHGFQSGINWAAIDRNHQRFPDRAAERLHQRQPAQPAVAADHRGAGPGDHQHGRQHARRRLRAGRERRRLQRLHRAAEHAGQDARALEPARLHAQQPEGGHQGRLG